MTQSTYGQPRVLEWLPDDEWPPMPDTGGNGTRWSRWTDLLLELREKPGTWAIVRREVTESKSLSNAIRHRATRMRKEEGHSYQFANRRNGEEIVVYARYLGTVESE
ncbi:MAG: hypothetical protein ACKVWR_21970 [Acidimicrobiales bacterium]